MICSQSLKNNSWTDLYSTPILASIRSFHFRNVSKYYNLNVILIIFSYEEEETPPGIQVGSRSRNDTHYNGRNEANNRNYHD